MDTLCVFSKNLRYLLMCRYVGPNAWARELSRILGGKVERASFHLEAQEYTLVPQEAESLKSYTQIPIEKLNAEELWCEAGPEQILRLNFAYLVGTIPYDDYEQLAGNVGVSAYTLSRWRTGKQMPTKEKIEQILGFLGLPRTLDLSSELMFLSNRHIGEFATKRWLKRRIDELEGKELSGLLPALMRLLGGNSLQGIDD